MAVKFKRDDIQPNWLLVWEQHDEELVLLMLNTGTHADIFGKIKR